MAVSLSCPTTVLSKAVVENSVQSGFFVNAGTPRSNKTQCVSWCQANFAICSAPSLIVGLRPTQLPPVNTDSACMLNGNISASVGYTAPSQCWCFVAGASNKTCVVV